MNELAASKSKTLASLDARLPVAGTAAERHAFCEQLRAACYEDGAFYLIHHGIPATLCEAALAGAASFFALSAESKARLDIKHAKHFRGYSRMSNERDWREPMHFGWELPASDDAPPGPPQLQGPNLWPTELGAAWRETMLAFLHAADSISQRLLAVLEPVLGLPTGYFAQRARPTPYLLMKLLCYYPSAVDGVTRQGVAPHCDWSWLTLLLQQQAGLQVRTRQGEWLAVPLVKDALVVNLGELLADRKSVV